MCTYNGCRFLEAQLQTIGNQTQLPFELLICDDGSTDATPDIVHTFAQSVSFPVYFIRNTTNLGSTKNFEKAILFCKGDIIALCDQDDLWTPEKLNRMASILEREPEVAAVFSNATLIDDNSIPIAGTLWERIGFNSRDERIFNTDQAFYLIQKPLVTGATLVFRASFVSDIVPIPSEWVHDEWIALILASLARIKPVYEFLISYRLHANQQIGLRKVPKYVSLQVGQLERVAFQRRIALKLLIMADKLANLPGNQKSTTYARAKAVYMNKRADLLEGGRFFRIFRGAAVLPGYFRFASGLVSYFRDFLHG